jgi:2,3-dihydroxybiphenyl 1,2-dioxygenase
MRHDIELAYLGIEVADTAAFNGFVADVIGLMPGAPSVGGAATWRNDGKAQRIIVHEGPANDAVYLGFEAANAAVFADIAGRIVGAGFDLVDGTEAEKTARRVGDLKHTVAPWGVRLELVQQLESADTAFVSPAVAGGFLTDGLGFGHTVFATTAFDESHRFLVDLLGMGQSDWLEMEIAEGIVLEVRFYHCNERHHTVAVANAPFALPQRLHHVMLEAKDRDDVGRAFDRAWNAGLPIANGLGRHDNDGMFSFYVVSPAGFQVEFGHGARTVGDDWDDNRRYDRVSAWGHQPLKQA